MRILFWEVCNCINGPGININPLTIQQFAIENGPGNNACESSTFIGVVPCLPVKLPAVSTHMRLVGKPFDAAGHRGDT